MIRLMPWPATIIEIGLAVFCFVDILLARETDSRWLPRWGWVLVLLFFPIVGGIGWIVAGRHWRTGRGRVLYQAVEPPVSEPRPARRGAASGSGAGSAASAASAASAGSADLELAAELSAINAEHEQTLRRWEAQLRLREADVRRRELELQGRGPAKS